ncbi:PREDICTED: protein GLUTAMINE DUMPER 6-like [Nelumbo nucifera]|uniref:Uncharacterized protein n=2 Tax=Nelumbo nucifera TaxID=4432 RepID=A0A822YUD5_NELNU|nr:PREDICTED: protein GLUTAMINE DUMPER 6-like [Nelumbo nucifera]DAD35161.1 TPA_asm: hypothetical protein HUJ06_005801 [Nelumbo nucifera]
MRPVSATTHAPATVATGFRRWNSPMPYLFAGIAAMLGLIALALLVLVCTHRKSSDNSSQQTEEKPANPISSPPDTEPKVVVVMPGEYKPTFIAKPVCSTNASEQV